MKAAGVCGDGDVGVVGLSPDAHAKRGGWLRYGAGLSVRAVFRGAGSAIAFSFGSRRRFAGTGGSARPRGGSRRRTRTGAGLGRSFGPCRGFGGLAFLPALCGACGPCAAFCRLA